MRLLSCALLAASPVCAQPSFVNRMPEQGFTHQYSGGWEHFVGGGVAAFDCNGDAFPELYVAGGETPAKLLRNDTTTPGGPLRFAVADQMALTGVTGAYPLDIDSDGHLDLMILRVGANQIWRGLGDCQFERADWGFDGGDRWSTAFSATWEPGQDWPTLAIGNYVDRTDPDGPFEACDVNELHRWDGTRYRMEELEPGFCALSVLISDWAREGRRDLRVSNDRHYYVRGGEEQMWRLDEMRLLTEADGWRKTVIWGMGIASRDITGDGRPEVMLTSMGDQKLQYVEDGPRLRDAPFSSGTAAQRPFFGDDGRPSTGWHAEFGDVNNDGLSDLFIAKGNVDQMPSNAMKDPNNLLIQGADGVFTEAADVAGIATVDRARGAVVTDLNRDGRLDIVVVNRRAELELNENQTEGGNWLTVDLQQRGANSRAVGAWIEMRKGGAVEAREVTVGGGHVSGWSGPQHFGLGRAEMAELRVIWPDGTAGDWQMLDAGTHHIVTRD
ncbi:hypothetical protein FHS89_000365 [Rubricella aquisinus]|uniref:ASPIC/UnbV domain-containing protein n=1 Tax=Rubricella aquisinus TaxID=2028108 RepID=A0A840X125_9RHOB|nr:CRTAC1 family protein [Rubricella aquisinus]MBB5514367.1 hypothetical protein [Rubricella aquisinus]